jgi:hypothetical protein
MKTGDQRQPGDEVSFEDAFEKLAQERGQPADDAGIDDDGDEAADAGSADGQEGQGGTRAVAQPPAADPEDPWKDAPPKLRQMYIDAQARLAAEEHKARSQAGRVSALQRKIDEIQASPRSSKPGAGDGPAAVDGDDDELKSLEQDFPSVVNLVRKTVKQEVDPIRSSVREREEREAEAAEETRIAEAFSEVAKVHPDFDQIRRDPAYAKWLGTQAPGIRNLAFSEDPADAIELFGMFKTRTRRPGADSGTRNRLVDAAVETPSKGAPRRVGIPEGFDGAFAFHADRIEKRNRQHR